MKKVKSLNGYSIFEAGPRDVGKYGYEAGSFYVFFSSDIRDFGIANSSPEYDGLDTLEAAEACCLGNYAGPGDRRGTHYGRQLRGDRRSGAAARQR